MLEEYIELNRQHSEAFHNKEFDKQKEIDKEIDLLHEDKFLPALKEIENIFCDTKDKKLLDTYVVMLEVIGHSASEAPRWAFGKMYTCHPYMVLEAIHKSDNKQQVFGDLGFGFENVIYTIDTTNLDINSLRKGIKELK